MACYRTILVVLDGSRNAYAAFRHAADLALEHHAQLVVVSIVPSPMFLNGIGAGSVVAHQDQAFAAELRRAVQKLPPDLGVRAQLTKGPPAQCVLRAADSCRCDLIVMGFRGHSRLRHPLNGSVSAAVARKSGRLVLLVRALSSQTASASLSNATTAQTS